MSIWDKFERRFGWLAVQHLALSLICAQLAVYALVLVGAVDYSVLEFNPAAISQGGEFWRLISFIIAPPYIPVTPVEALFIAIGMYLFHMMSGVLEAEWGTFRFNVYLLAAIFFSIVGGFVGYFVSPQSLIEVTPGFLYMSVFLGFATLRPDYEFYIMFVLPVKVKWLAWLSAGLVTYSVLFASSFGIVLVILAPIANYLLFFGPVLKRSVANRKRREQFVAEQRAAADEAFHTCSVCGVTDQSNPEMQFRYKKLEGEAMCICEVCRASA